MDSTAHAIRNEQREKFFEKLRLHKKCVFIAPPSLGKTTSSISFALEYTVRGRALFVFANRDSIKYAIKSFPETSQDTYITYASLLALVKEGEDLKGHFHDIDFILFDEAHKVYAENWQLGVKALIDAYPQAYRAGTSIGYRTDGRDYIKDFFSNICLAELDLSDCIRLGIVPKPTYVVLEKDMSTSINDLKKIVNELDIDVTSKSVLKTLAERNTSTLVENSRLGDLLTKYMDYSFEERGTMRFLAFCPSISYINSDSDWIQDEFRKAYPNKSIKIYKYHCKRGSDKVLSKEMIDFLHEGGADIKILCSCQKVAESIHFNGALTGLLFLRHTQSAMLFQQMFGRGLDANWSYPPIYFDIVNNIGQSFKYLPTQGKTQIKNATISVDKISKLQSLCVLYDSSLESSILLQKIKSVVKATMTRLDKREEIKVGMEFKQELTKGVCESIIINKLAKKYDLHTNYVRQFLRDLSLLDA